jgi:hypothetical protein
MLMRQVTQITAAVITLCISTAAYAASGPIEYICSGTFGDNGCIEGVNNINGDSAMAGFNNVAGGGPGVQGYSLGSSPASPGILGQGFGSNGNGVVGYYNLNNINQITQGKNGVLGLTASAFPAAGLYGSTTSPANGCGVYGNVTGTSSVGVEGQTDVGVGVAGFTAGTFTGNAPHGIAIGGWSTGSNGAAIFGNAPSGYAGYFNGNVTVTGTLTCGSGCNSDRRLKENIAPLKGALDKLLKLKGVTFAWKNPEEHQNHQGMQTGVIAQEVQGVFPQWVRENENGFLNVDPDARSVLGLTVEALRELKVENADLKARVKVLESAQRPAVSMRAGEFGLSAMAGVGLLGACALRRKREDGKPE